MSLETGTYISDLNIANPSGPTDPKSQGDDHLRLIKKVIKNTFPNLTGAMTATQAQLNALAVPGSKAIVLATGGVTKMVFYQAAAPTGWTKQVAVDNAALRVVSGSGGVTAGTANFTTAFASRTPTGTVGSTAITDAQMPSHNHTQQGTFNTGTVSADHSHFFSVSSGGRNAGHTHSIFGPVLGNMAHDGSSEGDFGVGGGYSHQSGGESVDHAHGVSGNTGGISANHSHQVTIFSVTTTVGSDQGHTHSFTGSAMDFAVKYMDVIICSLD